VAQKPTATVFGTEGVESKAAVHTAVCSAAELSCRTELLGVHTPDIRHLGRGSEIRTRRPSLSGAYCHFGVGVRGMLTCCLIDAEREKTARFKMQLVCPIGCKYLLIYCSLELLAYNLELPNWRLHTTIYLPLI
jgi:hypothetical protein